MKTATTVCNKRTFIFSNYDYAKEAKALPGNESISSSVLASDYRTYVKIIQGSKSETT